MQDILSQSIVKNLNLCGIRKSKINALVDMTESLLTNADLTLTSLGRNLSGKARVKHKIKRVDRWLDNEELFLQLPKIYKEILNPIISKAKELIVLVDWSGCCSNEQWCLRASLAYDGRSIPIYQEIHTAKGQQQKKVHNSFLEQLGNILPKKCKVIIVTDRGFGNDWFSKVRSMGWDFVGRVTSYVHYKLYNDNWSAIKKLYNKVTNTVKYLGHCTIAKTNPLNCEIFTYKEAAKNRKKHRTKGRPIIPKMEKQYREVNTAPWILVTSLLGGIKIARRLKNIYATRMQIEQNFRDDKSERFGFAFRYSRSKSIKRISILYLIGAIATYVGIILGTAAESLKLHKSFQANTVMNKRILSLIFLAKQVIKHSLGLIPKNAMVNSLKIIINRVGK